MARIASKKYDGDVVTITAPSDLVGGDVFMFGNELGGVVVSSVSANEVVGVQVKGVFSVPAAAADTIALGDRLYWDAANKVVTTDSASGANKTLGVAVSQKAAGVAGSVDVRLLG